MEFSDEVAAKTGPASLTIDLRALPLPHLLSTAAIANSPASQQFTTTSIPQLKNLKSFKTASGRIVVSSKVDI